MSDDLKIVNVVREVMQSYEGAIRCPSIISNALSDVSSVLRRRSISFTPAQVLELIDEYDCAFYDACSWDRSTSKEPTLVEDKFKINGRFAVCEVCNKFNTAVEWDKNPKMERLHGRIEYMYSCPSCYVRLKDD